MKNKIIGYSLIFIPLMLVSILFNTFWPVLIGIVFCSYNIWNQNKKKK